jgi:hypothetical protein
MNNVGGHDAEIILIQIARAADCPKETTDGKKRYDGDDDKCRERKKQCVRRCPSEKKNM